MCIGSASGVRICDSEPRWVFQLLRVEQRRSIKNTTRGQRTPMPTPFPFQDLGRIFDACMTTRGRTLGLLGRSRCSSQSGGAAESHD
jgi:hypothetical protein